MALKISLISSLPCLVVVDLLSNALYKIGVSFSLTPITSKVSLSKIFNVLRGLFFISWFACFLCCFFSAAFHPFSISSALSSVFSSDESVPGSKSFSSCIFLASFHLLCAW